MDHKQKMTVLTCWLKNVRDDETIHLKHEI